jgi:serine/threonine-protein kinase PknG
VLTMEFRGYQTTYLNVLPAQDTVPVFQRYDSFYRLVAKACAPNRDDRFVSADELRSQMVGVLREVVALDQGSGAAATTVSSLLFDVPTPGTEPDDWRNLPSLRRDPHDPMVGWLQTVNGTPSERLERLLTPPKNSTEVLLERARTALDAGKRDVAEATASELLRADPWEWRAVWIQGLAALERGDARGAQASFNAVYGQVPGELAPKLALALACELGGEPDLAERLYRICASTDANYVAPAAFGLARVRSGRRDVAGAVQALDLVPSTSRNYPESQRQKAELLYAASDGLPMLAQAMDSIARVRMDPVEKAELSAKILERALATVQATGPNRRLTIGGIAADDPDLRDGLEATYRTLASSADDDQERYALVDKANEVRRWTLT